MNMEKLTFEDGSVFEGEIVDNKPHGKGKLTYPNGKVKKELYVDGNKIWDLSPLADILYGKR